MNEFFQKLFSKLPHPTDTHKQPNPVTAQDHSAHTTRFQLAQMVLRTIMRKYSIPAHWVELKEVVVPGKTHGLGVHLRLVIRHWDANLMNHLQALQNQILSDIKRYEPNWKEWLYGLAWQMDTNDSCPYTTLPDKPFWVAPEQPVAAPHADIEHPAAHGATAHPAPSHDAIRPPASPTAPALHAVPVATASPAVHAAPIAAASAAVAVAALASHATEAAPVAPAPLQDRHGSEEHTTLERLFAIRDNQLSEEASDSRLEGQTGFEDTQPLDEDEDEEETQDGEPSELARIDLLASRPAPL